ncbi:MAG: integrase core domain-containing protein [Chthoniobacteraceae bacterium]
MAESFVATLKAECFAGSIPPTRAAAELMACDAMETFYNSRRRHGSLRPRSPRDFAALLFPHNQNIPTN